MEMGDPVEMDPKRITRRLMRLNMVAIHTTSVTITNALLDLYSSPRAEEYVAGLREECERVLKQHGGQWNKTAVNELYRIDSTIKESMRFSSLGITGLMRKVRVRESVCHCYRTPLPTSSEILPPLLHRSPFAIIDKIKKSGHKTLRNHPPQRHPHPLRHQNRHPQRRHPPRSRILPFSQRIRRIPLLPFPRSNNTNNNNRTPLTPNSPPSHARHHERKFPLLRPRTPQLSRKIFRSARDEINVGVYCFDV